MSGSVTQLTVFNMALAELQQEPITDVNDDSDKAATLRLYYDTALDVALKSHSWDFATKYATLTLVSDAENITPYTYLYALPDDFLEFQRVYNEDFDPVDFRNTSEGLYSNDSPLYMNYTYRCTDFGLFDTAFAQSLAFSLAELAAAKLLGSINREEFIEGKAGRKQAIAANKGIGRGQTTYRLESNWAQRIV